MVDPDFPIERSPNGLFFRPGGFYLDPKRKVEKAVISHAHADHAIASNEEVWCTPGTAAIMEARYGERLKSKMNLIQFDQPFIINGVTISFHAAGHVLGSAQTLMEFDGVKYCYTGDFKTRHDSSCEPFQLRQCDVLITETTFADPSFDHPEELSELEKLREFEQFHWIVGAYSLGKAQRITGLLNAHFPHRKTMVHPEPATFHKVYEKHGFDLGSWHPYDRHELKSQKPVNLVVPPKVLSSFQGTPGMVTMFATGWHKPFIRSNHHIKLSDHADWKEVLNLIRSSGAHTVMAVHGDGQQLKTYLNSVFKEIKVLI
ncbi:MAG: hypothetical protein RL090_767 [Bacteroidota bacterium]